MCFVLCQELVSTFRRLQIIMLSKILNSFNRYRERYGIVIIVLFPCMILYKIVTKTFIFSREIIEYGVYTFVEDKKYNIDYLKKKISSKDANALLGKKKFKKTKLMNCLDTLSFEQYDKFFTEGREEKVRRAELVCEHIFDLLGSGPTKLTQENGNSRLIDWQLDFKSGYHWDPKLFFRWIKWGNVKGVDIIVPWENSRFQDRLVLAQAYKLTNDTKYAIEFQNQVLDWIENNKFGFGVNWFCSMDISLRAVNWLIIMDLFDDSFDFPKAFLVKFYGSIYDHGRYIRKRLQHFGNVTTNHYISAIAGLLFIALYCPFFKRSKGWLNFAVRELECEMEKQVYPDGCDYEASTSYHILVLEIFFYSLLLCERVGVSLSESYRSKLKKMFECSLYYIKPNGMAPQIGDNDNGRFLKYQIRHVLEHKYLLSLATVYFKSSDFKLKQYGFSEEAFWVFGKDAKTIWDRIPFREDALGSKSFPNAGWYIIRNGNDYCFVTCGPNGQGGRGGHAHNDKLSLELIVDGQDVIVDPGTYAYTSDVNERNKFRSTGYHNTVKFNDYEQNEISKYMGVHILPDRVIIKKPVLKETECEIKFEGEIEYSDIVHKRIISLENETHNWKIIDCISSLKATNATLNFHLSPNVYYDNGHIFSRKTRKRIATITVVGYKLKKKEYDYSPEYGVKIKSECLYVTICLGIVTKTIYTYIEKSGFNSLSIL